MTRVLDEFAHAHARDRILDEARTLFANEGFHGASMSSLAEACKLTKAGLYHYFPSKHAILEALHQQVMDEAEAKLESFPKFKSLEEALFAAGQQYLAHFKEPRHRQMMQITFKLGLHDRSQDEPAFRFDNQRMDEKLLGLFIPYLPQGTPVKQARLFAQQFFGSLFFCVFAAEQLCSSTGIFDPHDYLKQLVRTFAADPKAALKGAS